MYSIILYFRVKMDCLVKLKFALAVQLSLLFLSNVAAFAEQDSVTRLSIGDCVDMALRENKEIKSAKSLVEQTLHTSKAYKANYFPRVSLNITDMWSSLNGNMPINVATPISQYIVGRIYQLAPLVAASETGSWYLSTLESRMRNLNPDVDFRVGHVTSANLFLEQPVYMGGKIRAAYKMGLLGNKMSQLGVEMSENEIICKTYETYALVVKAWEMISVADKYDSLLVSLRKSVESAISNGMASQADLMKVNSEIGKSELQKNKARNGYRLACMSLCQIIGLPLISEIEVDTLSIASMDNVTYTPDIRLRSEYDLLDSKTKLAEWNVKLERADFLPQVGVSVGGSYLNGLQFMDNRVFDNQLSVMALVNVKVPIFHGLEGYHKVAAAKAAYEQSSYERDNLYEMMELEILKSYNELNEAAMEADVYRKMFQSADESYRVAQVRYSKGMENLTDMLTAQVEWQNAYALMIEAKHSLAVKKIAWLKANGMLNK